MIEYFKIEILEFIEKSLRDLKDFSDEIDNDEYFIADKFLKNLKNFIEKEK